MALRSVNEFFKEERDPLYRRGAAKGHVEGREEGLEKGREEGRKLGLEEGKKEAAIQMKNSGLEVGLIANILGLSVEEIEKL